jgi:apolipoprotein N-acyltransferase
MAAWIGILTAVALYVAACPPHDWALAGWVAPGVLLVSAGRLAPARAFAAGVAFGVLMGAGVAGWVFHAMLEYFEFDRLRAAGFAFLVWLVYGGVPFGLLTAAYASLSRHVAPVMRPPLAAWLWVTAELVRAQCLTGLPWELLGHTQYRQLTLVQIADLGGVYAVSFVVVLASVAAVESLVAVRAGLGGRLRWAGPLVMPTAVLTATLAYGVIARAIVARTDAAAPASTVAVVQGNIPNAFRWKRAFFEQTLETYAGLTNATQPAHPDLIVWPENAADFYLDREPLLRLQLGPVAGLARAGLVLGGPRLASDAEARNAAYWIGPDGTVRAVYDKQRLVPFAEYDPFARLDAPPSDGPVYTPGPEAEPIHTGAGALGVVICYEVLFPRLVSALVRRGAEVLVNLSNDSWLDRGDGAAPRQHFSMSVFRAIETRRFLVRAAASGLSGFVTPAGEIYDTIPVGTAAARVGRVAARRGLTLYVRFGDAWVPAVGLAIVAALAAGAHRRSA